jgi:hypothetical protein
MLGGLAAGGTGEATAGRIEAFRGEADDDADDDGGDDATYTRYLAGAPRALNINDI